MFCISAQYPLNMINFAISREHLAAKGMNDSQIHAIISIPKDEEAAKDANKKRLIEMADKATHEQDKIVRDLRTLLIDRYATFVKMNGASVSNGIATTTTSAIEKKQ